MDDTREGLLARIKAYCAEHGVSEHDFGYAAVGDHRFVERLRADLGTLRVIKRADAFMAADCEVRRIRRRGQTSENVAA